MRTPAAVWEASANDERWLERQADMVDEIMREAFAAGVARGAALAASAIEGHAEQLATNLSALRLPESVARGVKRAAQLARELGTDAPIVQRVWREALAVFRPNAVTLQQVRP